MGRGRVNQKEEETGLLVAYIPLTKGAIIEIDDHPVEHTHKHKRVDQHGQHLAPKDGARGDLGVVAHLLPRDVVGSLLVEVLAEGGDEDEGLGAAREPEAAEQLEEHVEVHFHVGRGPQQRRGHEHDGADARDGEEGPPGHVDGPDLERDEAQRQRDGQDAQEPPVGHLGVGAHQAREGVVVAVVDGLPLAVLRQAAPHLGARPLEGLPVLDRHAEEGQRVPGEPAALPEHVGAREEGRAVRAVGGHVDAAGLRVEDAGHVVLLAVVGEDWVNLC